MTYPETVWWHARWGLSSLHILRNRFATRCGIPMTPERRNADANPPAPLKKCRQCWRTSP